MSSPIRSPGYDQSTNPPSVRIIPSSDPKRILPTIVSYFPVPHNLVVKYAKEHYGYEAKEEDFPHMYPGSEVTPPPVPSWKAPSMMAPGEEQDETATKRAADAARGAFEDMDPPGRLTGLEKAELNRLSSQPREIPKQAEEEEIPYLSPPKPRRPSQALTCSYASLPPLTGSYDANLEGMLKSLEDTAKSHDMPRAEYD